MKIKTIQAYQIFDSRGVPTVEAEVVTTDGKTGRGTVPSGASTGQYEALELRDGDKSRFRGKSVMKAVGHVNGEIADALRGRDVTDQAALDQALIDLDGTPNKSRLGANAILAVSMAAANAAANVKGVPLFESLGDGTLLPLPEIQIVGGGAHANWRTDLQDFLLVANGARDYAETLEITHDVFHAAGDLMKSQGRYYGAADEGGGERAQGARPVERHLARLGREGHEGAGRGRDAGKAGARPFAGGRSGAGERRDLPDERVVAAGVQEDELLLRVLTHEGEERVERHRLQRQFGEAADVGRGRDQVVLAADLDAVPGIVEQGDVGADHRLDEALEGLLHADLVEVGAEHDLEVEPAQRLGDGARVLGRVRERRRVGVGAVADDERDAPLGERRNGHQNTKAKSQDSKEHDDTFLRFGGVSEGRNLRPFILGLPQPHVKCSMAPTRAGATGAFPSAPILSRAALEPCSAMSHRGRRKRCASTGA